MALQTLRGSCACGRNRYVIEMPSQQARQAELRYDKTSASRHLSASPLALWLRVPLAWYTSATFAQFPDETRTTIQRTFTSPFASHTRRQFCGYCGSPLSAWNGRTPDEADHICLTIGSLVDDDQALLSDLGFFPGVESSDDDTALPRTELHARGAPWFEDMVRHTPLGRFRQQRGAHSDSGVRVEWEVVEWTEAGDAGGADDADNDQAQSSPTKRKIGDVESEDTVMQSA